MSHLHPNAGLRLPQRTLDHIATLLYDKEKRSEFLREAVEREIRRREEQIEFVKRIAN